MIALSWVRGLIAHRPTRILATVVGVAVGVALIASIGTFLSATNARMTQRAIARVPVDWQVETQPGADATAVVSRVEHFPGVKQALPVNFATAPSMSATTQGFTQTTGGAQVLGLPAGYAAAFPGQLRLLTGTLNGPVLAQQTASNLHAAPGARSCSTFPEVVTLASRSPESWTCPPPTRSFRRSAPPSAHSSRHPPTTCCCCPPQSSPAWRRR